MFESTNQLTLDIPQSPFSSRKPIPLMLSSIVLIIIKVGKSLEVGSNWPMTPLVSTSLALVFQMKRVCTNKPDKSGQSQRKM